MFNRGAAMVFQELPEPSNTRLVDGHAQPMRRIDVHKVLRVALAAAATFAMYDAAQAQESNPVTSNPPVDAIGRLSETSPGTPDRQNSAPGIRSGYSYYGPAYYGPYAGYGGSSYLGYGYEEPPAIVITPNAVVIDVE